MPIAGCSKGSSANCSVCPIRTPTSSARPSPSSTAALPPGANPCSSPATTLWRQQAIPRGPRASCWSRTSAIALTCTLHSAPRNLIGHSPHARAHRLPFSELEAHAPFLRHAFTEPWHADPSYQSAEETRKAAEDLTELAQQLENGGHAPKSVAVFLTRCLFTMVAEAAGLLPDSLRDALQRTWLPHPDSFPGGIASLWKALRLSPELVPAESCLDPVGDCSLSRPRFPWMPPNWALLLRVAGRRWTHIEPAIFGTLLGRALRERDGRALGVHYTPRAYVERLVRPALEAPLRHDWAAVQAQVRSFVPAW